MSRSERRAPALRVGRATSRRAAALGAAIGLALAAGCATVPPPAPPSAPPAAPRAVEGPREWNGRFSVRLVSSGAEGGQDAAFGRFSLVRRPAPTGRVLELALVSPFGQTLADARRGPDGASTLRLADGRTLRAGSLDGLVEQALGWPLPVERLPDWLDDRFETVLARDARGTPTLARDSGWRIEREAGRWSLARPRPDGELRVVLVLDR
ncbi:MAG TPA: outer membrane lipoprotein LolB [Burkholderiaceae bacterium]|nr:outer membrane lipoprotein LolB [Burkholderiaceae bacterium]